MTRHGWSLSFLTGAAVAAGLTFGGQAHAQPAAGPPASDPNAQVAAPAAAPSVIVVQQQAAPAPAAPAYANMRGAEWEPGDPIPPGYHPEGEIRQGLVIAGAVTLGTTWLLLGVLPASLTLAACSEFGSSGTDCALAGTLFVPAIGPFIAMPFATESALAEVLLAFDGLAQSSGAVMLILGLALQKDVLVKDVAIGDTDIKFKPTPMSVGRTGNGFGVVGTF